MPVDDGSSHELTREFLRWREHGDVGALARVFDATASRLALVAAHLAGDAAEDVVQATFLEALRSAARFDPQRPLLPWLLGILANRAADLRRSRARQATCRVRPR